MCIGGGLGSDLFTLDPVLSPLFRTVGSPTTTFPLTLVLTTLAEFKEVSASNESPWRQRVRVPIAVHRSGESVH